ncbi:aminotransferase class V-fold PLP-dependent enzyme [Pelotomaculum propionicicum]|uniref:cysteine desulfurase n=1 Tax=Pelotomaculum propionicicum TaxID=258475 RepID=A0A4Y7RUL4_9FIRM|nr:aminotransferase class V-fold PLP-dependent enzyme [Pelotomaculum propionicicum]NLI12205.1 aminotransferase class V-fold PLP-dependent enzyme [Peptococcaceae bacterium]TEB12563.1 Cysteine desulfurase SufS [Pelotomaculum propionicicum]
MIYFDSAATTWPKPAVVWQAMESCIRNAGANPGRSGHQMALMAGRLVDEARELLATLFNITNPDRIVFTVNATEALNLAIKGLLKPGDHVVTSSMEHNSVTRPLYVLQGKGIEVSKVSCARDGTIKIEDIEKAIRPNTKAIVITHASNVTGTLMPIAEIGQLARKKGLRFVVDAAQTAGVFNINVPFMKIDLLAFPGHKGLYGPTGTGGLYIAEGLELTPLKEGGTGSMSDVPGQPDIMPERYESGTLNAVGIAGLAAGLKFIRSEGAEKIRQHEMELTQRFLKGAEKIKGLSIYGPEQIYARAPVVSFSLAGKATGKVGTVLDKQYNIACRAGLHCAPDAHRTLGTFDQKLVRFSFSYFNKTEEVDYALRSLNEISAVPPEKFNKSEKNGSCGC